MFEFPVNDSSAIQKFREHVEKEKARLNVNETLTECMLSFYTRAGFNQPEDLTALRKALGDYVKDIINPAIQDVLLNEDLSKNSSTY